jgi:hypothetical protein
VFAHLSNLKHCLLGGLKMAEQFDPDFNADIQQLKALMKVMDEITAKRVPLIDQTALVTNKNIRNLENWCSEYVFDDGDLVQDLKSAIIELKYLLSIITDLRERLKERDAEVSRLERLFHRE